MDSVRTFVTLSAVVLGTCAQQAIRAVTGSTQAPTVREFDVPASRQYRQWLGDSSDIWSDRKKDTDCFLSIGSLRNAVASDVATAYNGVVNCCPSKYAGSVHAQCVEIDMDDTNDVAPDPAQFNAAFRLVRESNTLDNGKTVLVHCSMGASRSVAVAIYILGRHYQRRDYDYWLQMLRTQRKHINPSLALRMRVQDMWSRDRQ